MIPFSGETPEAMAKAMAKQRSLQLIPKEYLLLKFLLISLALKEKIIFIRI